jgi:uncharacterized membrane protein
MTIRTSLTDQSGQRQPFAGECPASRVMKAASIIAGSVLAGYGVSRRDIPGAAMAAGGGYLAYRGLSACSLSRMGNVRVAFTVNRPPEDVFRFVRDPHNWRTIMPGLGLNASGDRVFDISLGRLLHSQIQITEEKDGDYIAWSSLPDGFEHRGVLHVHSAPGNRGSELSVAMEFYAPGGRIARALASFLGGDPEQQVRESLRRIKQLLEVGEVPTTEGQPHGARGVKGRTLRVMFREPQAEVASRITKLAGD